MANTYSQIYFHIVFAVRGRKNAIDKYWQEDLYRYITGIVQNKEQKMIIIGGMPDHLHILVGTKPNCNLSDLVRDIKANSSRWINENDFTPFRFEWQTGFGVFSLGQSQLQWIINYIKNQETHHCEKTFRKEYIEFLETNEIDYNIDYIFTHEQ